MVFGLVRGQIECLQVPELKIYNYVGSGCFSYPNKPPNGLICPIKPIRNSVCLCSYARIGSVEK